MEAYIKDLSPIPALLTLPCIETKPQSNKYSADIRYIIIKIIAYTKKARLKRLF